MYFSTTIPHLIKCRVRELCLDVIHSNKQNVYRDEAIAFWIGSGHGNVSYLFSVL
jgi:hypothetical protein